MEGTCGAKSKSKVNFWDGWYSYTQKSDFNQKGTKSYCSVNSIEDLEERHVGGGGGGGKGGSLPPPSRRTILFHAVCLK